MKLRCMNRKSLLALPMALCLTLNMLCAAAPGAAAAGGDVVGIHSWTYVDKDDVTDDGDTVFTKASDGKWDTDTGWFRFMLTFRNDDFALVDLTPITPNNARSIVKNGVTLTATREYVNDPGEMVEADGIYYAYHNKDNNKQKCNLYWATPFDNVIWPKGARDNSKKKSVVTTSNVTLWIKHDSGENWFIRNCSKTGGLGDYWYFFYDNNKSGLIFRTKASLQAEQNAVNHLRFHLFTEDSDTFIDGKQDWIDNKKAGGYWRGDGSVSVGKYSDDDSFHAWIEKPQYGSDLVVTLPGEDVNIIGSSASRQLSVKDSTDWMILPASSNINVKDGGLLVIDCPVLCFGAIHADNGTIIITENGRVLSVHQNDDGSSPTFDLANGSVLEVEKGGKLFLSGIRYKQGAEEMSWKNSSIYNYGSIYLGEEQIAVADTELINYGTFETNITIWDDDYYNNRSTLSVPDFYDKLINKASSIDYCCEMLVGDKLPTWVRRAKNNDSATTSFREAYANTEPYSQIADFSEYVYYNSAFQLEGIFHIGNNGTMKLRGPINCRYPNGVEYGGVDYVYINGRNGITWTKGVWTATDYVVTVHQDGGNAGDLAETIDATHLTGVGKDYSSYLQAICQPQLVRDYLEHSLMFSGGNYIYK